MCLGFAHVTCSHPTLGEPQGFNQGLLMNKHTTSSSQFPHCDCRDDHYLASSSSRAILIPFPPPPADALIITG